MELCVKGDIPVSSTGILECQDMQYEYCCANRQAPLRNTLPFERWRFIRNTLDYGAYCIACFFSGGSLHV